MSLLNRKTKKTTGRAQVIDDDIVAKADKTLITPRHVAIIMDGNGRWAKLKSMPRSYGHRAGSKAIRKTIKASVKLGVEYLSLYTFSSDNWGRPQTEVDTLMRLIKDNLIKELPELHAEGVKITALGRLDELPEQTRKAFVEAMEITKDNTRLNLQVAVNYSGYNEILDAISKITQTNIKLSEEEFRNLLYAPDMPYPDLLIRTGGEYRISNFLLWQIAYTELWFTETLWPDFDEDTLVQAIIDYSKRERRFGKLAGEV